MFFKSKHSYHVKMAFVFSFIMILMFFAYNFILLHNRNSVFEKDYIMSVENNVKQLVNNMESEVSTLSMLSFSMVSNTDLIEEIVKSQNNNKSSYVFETHNKIQEYIASQLSAWSKINGIYIYSTTGDIFCSAINNYGSDNLDKISNEYDYKKSEWYQVLSNNQYEKTIYYDNNMSHFNNTDYAYVSYIRAIKELDKFKTIAYLKIDMPIKEIIKEKVNKGLGNKDYYVIREGDDVLLSNFNSLNLMRNINLKNYEEITQNVEGTPWVMTYYASKENLLTQKRNMAVAFVVISIIGVCIIMVLTQYITYIMAKRIKKLEKAMEQVEKGDLDTRIEISNNDDISLICQRFNMMVTNLKKTYQQLYAAEIETKAAHIRALQSQINPHFFYNTMECIDALSYESGNKSIGKIVMALSKNFRYAFKENVISSLQKEVEHVKEYINIMKIRYPKKFEVIYIIPENLMDVRIPRISLQPIIENSILHGLLKKRGNGKIVVEAYIEKECVRIKVLDDGIGLKDSEIDILNQKFMHIQNNEQTKNIGLINVNNRIKYYFGEKYGMSIEMNNNGMTVVVLTLPLN